MKMTTTASGRIAGSKRQIGKALCTITGRKSNGSEKKYHVIRKTAHLLKKIKAIIAVCQSWAFKKNIVKRKRKFRNQIFLV